MTNMFTFSLQTSDNQTPWGAASLMKTQELLSRPAVSLCQKYAAFIQTSKSICTKKRSQIICSKHTIRDYFSISFLVRGKKHIQMPFIFFQRKNMKIRSSLWRYLWSTHRSRHIQYDWGFFNYSQLHHYHNQDSFHFLYADWRWL